MFAKTIKNSFYTAMILQGLLWIVFSIIQMNTTQSYFIVTLLMIANALAFFGFAVVFKFKILFLRILTLIFLFINLILTFTDQMGFWDYLVLALNVINIFCFIYLFKSQVKEKRSLPT